MIILSKAAVLVTPAVKFKVNTLCTNGKLVLSAGKYAKVKSRLVLLMIDGKISKFTMIGQNLQNGLFNQMHDGKGIPHRSNGGTSRQV